MTLVYRYLASSGPLLIYSNRTFLVIGKMNGLDQSHHCLINVPICHIDPMELSKQWRHLNRFKQDRKEYGARLARYLAV